MIFFPTLSNHDQNSTPVAIGLSDGDDDDKVRILDSIPKINPFSKRQRINIEKGVSLSTNSNVVPFIYEICTETKIANDAFFISGCSHAYCLDYVILYPCSKLEANMINVCALFLDCLLEDENDPDMNLYCKYEYLLLEAYPATVTFITVEYFNDSCLITLFIL